MQWFRLYSSVLHDPKVQRLHPGTFKHWINILCLASENRERGVVPCAEDVAYALRVKPVEARDILTKLKESGLLDKGENGDYTPHNWTKFQRVADDVATRVRRHRNKKDIETDKIDENVTLLKRTVDTDTDTDTDKTIKPLAPKPRKPRPPSGDQQTFIAWFMFAYEKVTGSKYILTNGKDSKAVSEILKATSLKDAIARAAMLFISEDAFFKDKPKDITFFRSQVNKVLPVAGEHIEQVRQLGIAPPKGTKFEDWKFWETPE